MQRKRASCGQMQNEAILLIHFSARYSATSIRRLLEERLPEGLRERCTPLLLSGFK